MYAIFENGSHQYRVQEGQTVDIDYRECAQGDTLTFEKVLFVSGDASPKIGLPLVAGAKVTGEVVGFPSIKVVSQLFRRRKNVKKLRGHRQPYVRVKITSIAG